MEFDSYFAKIQGILKSHERLYGQLININKENDSKLSELKVKMSFGIESKPEGSNDLRRLYLLLLLNADTNCYDYLHEDLNCGHVVGSIPKLSRYLFMALVDHLKLTAFLFESIVYLLPVLSIEVVDMCMAFTKSIKDPFLSFQYIDIVARSVFLKSVYLSAEEEIEVKLKYYELFITAMEYFNTSKTDDFKSWKENKLYYLSAKVMRVLASIVKNCCKHYLELGDCRQSCNDIYNIKITKRCLVDIKLPEYDSADSLLKNCLGIVLSKLLTTAQSVTVIVWLAWTEMEEFTDENVQLLVGNDVYGCLDLIKQDKIKESVNSHLHSELVSVLSNLSIKPADEDDEIRSANPETILNALHDPTKTRAKWLSALISRDDFSPDLKMLSAIQENIRTINSKDTSILLAKCVAFVNQEQNRNEALSNLFKDVVLSSLDNFHVDNQITILESFIIKYGITDVLKMDGFELRLTEVLNRVVDMNDDAVNVYSDVIRLSLQSPVTVIRKSVKTALLSTQHGKSVLKLLKILNPICIYKQSDRSDENVLLGVVNEIVQQMEDLTENERDNFVDLVMKLVSKSFLDGGVFLKDYLMPQLHESIKHGNWPVVLQSLSLLQNLINKLVTEDDNGGLNLPVLIIFLCQLVDNTRGSFSNFNLQSVTVCDKAIQVLIGILEVFDADEQEIATMNWIKEELQQLTVITQMHVFSYVKSSMLSDHISKKSIEVYWLKLILCGADGNDFGFLFDLRRDSFVRTLSKVLPLFTSREWKIMFTDLVPKNDIDSLCALMFATIDAVLLLEAAVVPRITSDGDNESQLDVSSAAEHCLHFCIKNTFCVIQDVILPCVQKVSAEHLIELLIKLCYILHNFPPAARNSSSWTLLKVLQSFISIIIQRYQSVSSDQQKTVQINTFFAAISLINNTEIRQNLAKSVLAGFGIERTTAV